MMWLNPRKKSFGAYLKILQANLFQKIKTSLNPPLFLILKSGWNKFKQPIILTSSTDKKNQATLVSLGNNEERLTWVSSDGISLSYDDGVLIATRGYSQDLLSLKYKKPKKIFSSSYLEYDKTHRYLNGENRYNEIHFKCIGKKMAPRSIEIVEYYLLVDRYVETCVAAKHRLSLIHI